MSEPTLSEAQQILRLHDDAIFAEFPQDFDRQATGARFEKLVNRLENDFACECSADVGGSIQDSSHFGSVAVPAKAVHSGADIFFRVSNFGTLAMFGLKHPRAYNAAELGELFDHRDRDRCVSALADLGYTTIPEAALHVQYDGLLTGLAKEPPPHGTWYTRFFSWL